MKQPVSVRPGPQAAGQGVDDRLTPVTRRSAKVNAHHYRISPQLVSWCLLGIVPVVLLTLGLEPARCQMLLALVGLAHSAVAFWKDGGRRISAPGVFCYGTALFVYFPALYIVFDDTIRHGRAATFTALAIAYAAQLLMYHLAWEPAQHETVASTRPTVSSATSRGGVGLGIILLTTGLAGTLLERPEVIVTSSLAYCGVVLIAVSALGRSTTISVSSYVVVGGSLVLYVGYVFAGFGRLTIGSLGIALCMAAALRWRGRTIKALILVGTTPVLLYLARSRVAYVSNLYNHRVAENGLESVIAPFIRFSELLVMQADGRLLQTWGRSFWAAAVFFVPRSLWPEKPVGFGAELVPLVSPQLVGTGHSEVATYLGEWLVSFGLLGIAGSVPVLALAVRLFDRFLVRTQSRPIASIWRLCVVVIAILLCSGLPDLVWGGSGTYITRVATRVAIVAVLLLPFALIGLSEQRRKQDSVEH